MACCQNCTVSTVDPCCADVGALWWNPATGELQVMDSEWNTITGSSVNSVNGQTGTVVLEADDILGEPSTSNVVWTDAGWKSYTTSVSKGSTSLVTSGAVYNFLSDITTSIDDLEEKVAQLDTDFIESSALTTEISSASTDSQVPSAKAVYEYLVSQGEVKGTVPIVVTKEDTSGAYVVSVKSAMRTSEGVVRLATDDDYTNEDATAVLTPSIIKPIIDGLITRIEELEQFVTEQKEENEYLQKQIDELKS